MKDYEEIACEMMGVDNPDDLPIAALAKLKAVDALCGKASSHGYGGAGSKGRLVSRQAIAHILVDTL